VSERVQRALPKPGLTALIQRLRIAGCVFAEEEVAALAQATSDSQRLEQLVRRREAGEPLEQVVGCVNFGGLRLAVGPRVFAPRQRSLLLARISARLARAQPAPVLLEACAGTAPIASTVARAVPAVETHASDVDSRALGYARRNLTLDANLHHGHLLDATPPSLRGRITLLVAVAPYVPLGAAELLPREAREYEPAQALFGGHDGLDHVRELVNGARPWLAPDARVLMELHSGQYEAAAEHAEHTGFSARRHDGRDGQTTVLDLCLT
jgi:release factor glutamine methyltransferase